MCSSTLEMFAASLWVGTMMSVRTKSGPDPVRADAVGHDRHRCDCSNAEPHQRSGRRESGSAAPRRKAERHSNAMIAPAAIDPNTSTTASGTQPRVPGARRSTTPAPIAGIGPARNAIPLQSTSRPASSCCAIARSASLPASLSPDERPLGGRVQRCGDRISCRVRTRSTITSQAGHEREPECDRHDALRRPARAPRSRSVLEPDRSQPFA